MIISIGAVDEGMKVECCAFGELSGMMELSLAFPLELLALFQVF